MCCQVLTYVVAVINSYSINSDLQLLYKTLLYAALYRQSHKHCKCKYMYRRSVCVFSMLKLFSAEWSGNRRKSPTHWWLELIKFYWYRCHYWFCLLVQFFIKSLINSWSSFCVEKSSPTQIFSINAAVLLRQWRMFA